MVFFYFGPSASSWATGNDQFAACRQLPQQIQSVWDSLGEHFPDRSLGGTRIDWMSTAGDGSYCIMLKDGNVLSNRNDLLQSLYTCRQSYPYAVLDHVSFSPYGAYLIRFNTGHVMLSPETSGRFPDTFLGLASDFLHFTSPARDYPQPTQLEHVFWGPSDSVLLKSYGGALRWQGLPDALVSELRALTVGVDMLSAGFQLGKRTTLCPWDGGLYFLEFASFLGNTAKAYPYSLRQYGLSGDAMQYVVLNQRPPPYLLETAAPTQLPPPPKLPPPPPTMPPTPPASAPPGAAPGSVPPLPPRPASMVQPLTQSPPTPLPTPYIPTRTPVPTSSSAPPALPPILLPEEQEQPKSEDEERIDAFVNSLAMPDDIRASAVELWDACTRYLEEPKYLTAEVAMQLFAASELSSEDIDMIWEKSDLDHNGLLDREEFLQAIYLMAVQQYLRGVSDQYGLEARLTEQKGQNENSVSSAASGIKAVDDNVETSRDLPRDATRDKSGQPSLRGTVKDIFKMFVDTSSQVSQAYMQNYQTAYKEALKQQQQQELAIQAEYEKQSRVSQQQLMEAMQAMGMGAEGSIATTEAATDYTAAMSSSRFGSGGGGGGANDGEGDKDSKSGMAKQLRDSLMGSIVTESPNVHWEDVAGLEPAKDELQEAVVFPLRFPHMFQGKRKPRRAILLYGPPGTGKSYLAKAVATEVEYTLFSISATDLTSKWFGESEGLVRELFELAREKKPSVIFIDEIDALCQNRESGGGGGGAGDDATTSRLKTEFLVQMDGVGHGDNEGVVLLAATNLPWSLDPAIRRRFQKRIHIPLPDADARLQLFRVHGGEEWTGVVGPAGGMKEKAAGTGLAQRTEGFSGSDVANAVQDALMLPVKRVRGAKYFRRDGVGSDWWVPCMSGETGAQPMTWKDIPNGKARAPPLTLEDFFTAVSKVKPSVGENEIQRCEEWTAQFGLEGA
ncbi:hypothetical protein SEUCBS139899_002681 [Sporothrix eucalyptigena]